MKWQDWVFGIGQFLFFIALIPSIRGKDKPAFNTSLLTAAVLTVNIPAMYTLHLKLGTFTTVLIAIGWWILAWQVWKNKPPRSL